MNLENAVNIDDLRRLAKRRLPKVLFDFIEGGVEDEQGLATNEDAFKACKLIPRYMVDVSKRDPSVELFGKTYSLPFGISPTGTAGIFRRGADLMLAEAARIANVPFIMSSAAHASVAEATKIAPDNTWFQHYPPRDRSVGDTIIRNAADAGVKVLVVTADVPVLPRRERNMRNGLGRGTTVNLRLFLDGLLHPAWLFEYLRHGAKPPVLENWRQFAAAGANAAAVSASLFSEWPSPDQTWEDFARMRKLWPGRLLIKGVLHAADAARAVETGADGIIISNHGGRQFDRAPSPLEAMPAIRSRVGEAVPLIVEGGVRRSVDILAAFCLGAQFVLVGRPTLYGAAAGGLAGVNKAIDILRQELNVNMAQMGCASMGMLSRDCVFVG